MVGGIDDGITGHVGQVFSSQQGDPLVQLSCGVGGAGLHLRPPLISKLGEKGGVRRMYKKV